MSAPPTVLPPPDVPAAKGSMLNILDGLRKKPACRAKFAASRTGKPAARARRRVENARAGSKRKKSKVKAGEAGKARQEGRRLELIPSNRALVEVERLRRDRGR